ncbi:NAD-binding Rossmann fold oxidoreductase [Cytidiella melzeri]|nr:NAD-binding Rossmann fold oxidoreductase [Cytidiella melzeri]
MAPIRLGVIGLSANKGWASTDLIPPIFDPLLADKYTLTALSTSSEQSAKNAAEKYSSLAGHTVKGYYGTQGWTDIANDPEVDLVVVSVKVPDHYAAILPAIEAGKDVFVEWTPGKNLDETLRMAQAANAKGVRSLVGAQAAHAKYLRKVKEIVQSGKIGRVLSTSLTAAGPFLGKRTLPSLTYSLDIENGANYITILVGHFLFSLKAVLGTFAEVSATGAIRFPTVHVIDPSTGQTVGGPITKTAHDQVILSGILKGRAPEHDGVVANIHYQGGVDLAEPFRWIIYGEDGTIEIKCAKGTHGDFASSGEKDVYLNGEKLELEEIEVDKLGGTGKAWLEFSKGRDGGSYESLDDAVDAYRVLDAALTSIREGKKIVI